MCGNCWLIGSVVLCCAVQMVRLRVEGDGVGDVCRDVAFAAAARGRRGSGVCFTGSAALQVLALGASGWNQGLSRDAVRPRGSSRCRESMSKKLNCKETQ